ncbi:DNA polymerase ligase-domain-containing protein [Fusarium tricinctum]|uniref:DNA polymerase ligase-domain-containing protein n=1 Tax=Fusarium tricinctum TaxID=61284 RepID=A0A8K0S584_9HYPO|nr:DNA polymerase ligase-domain-containing protein [Fusarium tricinctum]
MPEKRSPSPGLISNPFIKKRNLEWTLDSPSLSQPPATAEIEPGSATIDDHLSHFKRLLSKHIIAPSPLSIASYASLYTANAGSTRGAHFVIHQHDHPIAGTHYDLRLQINESSSVSWAIMYGLPGDPNSIRLNRNATETRIHCLWNHLIETASASTGSLLIWDTGTYSILPRESKHSPPTDPSSPPSSPTSSCPSTPQALLHAAFHNRKIRLRLHGRRLPDPYVLNLRLTKSEDVAGRVRSGRTSRKRRRRGVQMHTQPETTDEDESDVDESEDVPTNVDESTDAEGLSAMERELRELEDEEVRRTNSYPGASNTIGSIHQRRWYLSLDRPACGFLEKRTNGRSIWELQNSRETKDEKTDNGRLSYPFYVRGSDHEQSVVTGRQGGNILKDEGVDKFVQRKGWKPVFK